MNVGGVLLGASLFGCGWALSGLCPGTSLGALGEGRLHAVFSIAGMLAGAMLFARTYGFLDKTVLSWKDYGKIGMPELTGLPALALAALFCFAAILLMRIFDKKMP
jgi:uncharacterized membrane protein YedE/YeeE